MERLTTHGIGSRTICCRAAVATLVLMCACSRADSSSQGRSSDTDSASLSAAESTAEASTRTLQLVETGRILGVRAGTAFGRLALVAIDPQANIFAFDEAEAIVHRFDSLGGFAGSLGRRGAGPGEFGHLIGMVSDGAGLWTVDGSNARYTRFVDGRVVAEARRPSTTYRVPWLGGIGDDGHLYDGVVDAGSGRDLLLKLDGSGNVLDTVSLPPLHLDLPRRGKMEFPLPYSPQVLRAFDPGGASFTGRTDEYRLVRITFSGDTTRVVSRPIDRRPLRQQERDSIAKVVAALAEELNVAVEESAIPQTFPLLNWSVVDDQGRLWVGRWDRDGAPTVDVIDRDGSLQSNIPLPFRLVPGTRPAVARDRFVGIVESALGEHEIHIARIEGEPRGAGVLGR